MKTSSQADFLNELDLSLGKAWELLRDGAANRRSGFHLPSVATVYEGHPRQRIMVCREADPDQRLLRFHTDQRSAKVTEIGNGAAVSIIGYDPDEKIQLRLAGLARIERNGKASDRAWNDATLFGKRCYLAEPGPGSVSPEPVSGLPADLEGRQPSAEEVQSGRSNFAILLVEIDQIEWLFLAHTGHRRAIFNWNAVESRWQGQWLVP